MNRHDDPPFDGIGPTRQSDVAVGHGKVGSALMKLGDHAGALTEYRSFQTVAQKLAATDPTNLDWQGMVVECHGKVGDALFAQRDVPGARAEYQSGLELARQLTLKDPSFAERVTSLSAKIARAR